MLTKKQNDLLRYIDGRLRESGVPPSFDEMRVALDLKSKSGVHRLVLALEERGFLRRLPNRARALEVVRPPTRLPEGARGATRLVPLAARELSALPNPASAIPLMGRIAAGTPVSALQHVTRHLAMPPEMLQSTGNHYALEVRGDSMIEAGILDGDAVVIRRQSEAENGEIVVALIDEEEATLKRFRRRGAAIALEAANPAYETRIYGCDRVRVQGKLVGLIRSYA